MKYLFIDDSAEWLRSIRRIFGSNPNVVFAECHSVKDALCAIAEHKPEVIFLDHSLTDGGNEGLKIADQAEGVKTYSTAANGSTDLIIEYLKRGIEWVGKGDLAKLKSIIVEINQTK